MPVRDYRAWSHDDDIHMEPGTVHEPYSGGTPGDFSPDLESALAAIAKQDVSLTGGPRGKLPQHGQ